VAALLLLVATCVTGKALTFEKEENTGGKSVQFPVDSEEKSRTARHDEPVAEKRIDPEHNSLDGYWKKKLIWKPDWVKIYKPSHKKIYKPEWKKYYKPDWEPTQKAVWVPITVPAWKKIYKPVWEVIQVPAWKEIQVGTNILQTYTSYH